MHQPLADACLSESSGVERRQSFATRWNCNEVFVTKLTTTSPNSLFRVNVSNRLSPADAIARPSLDAFQQAAQEGDWVHVSRDGAQWKVLGTGTTPSQRFVAWIEPEVDSTSAFVGALGQSFSQGIQASVVKELGLNPAPGKPLSSRTVMQAIDMAQTSRLTLQGVDFLTQLTLSAVGQSTEFKDACRAGGVSVQAVTTQQRESIDTAMQQRFEAAALEGRSPVALQTAREWLREELRALQIRG